VGGHCGWASCFVLFRFWSLALDHRIKFFSFLFTFLFSSPFTFSRFHSFFCPFFPFYFFPLPFVLLLAHCIASSLPPCAISSHCLMHYLLSHHVASLLCHLAALLPRCLFHTTSLLLPHYLATSSCCLAPSPCYLIMLPLHLVVLPCQKFTFKPTIFVNVFFLNPKPL